MLVWKRKTPKRVTCNESWVCKPFEIAKFEESFTYFELYLTIGKDVDSSIKTFRTLAAAQKYTNKLVEKITKVVLESSANNAKRVVELEKALSDYISETGIGSTLLPDVKPPESNTMTAYIKELEDKVFSLENELKDSRNKLYKVRKALTEG